MSSRHARSSGRVDVLAGVVAPLALMLAVAWRVRAFTIDDAFISFRYAEHFARGDGLVYNLGEHVEGYTSFLWTALLAMTAWLGADTERFSKLLGVASAAAALALTYRLSTQLRPRRRLPVLSTWLLASSMAFSGYAVFGLESPLFLALVLAATSISLEELESPSRAALSGLLFALGTLARPEGVLSFGAVTIAQGRESASRTGRLRLAAFALPVLIHLAFRRAYYGAWLPNTFDAKTGGGLAQLSAGLAYLHGYSAALGPWVWLAVLAAATAALARDRGTNAISLVVASFAVYVALVGGDWMPCFRFMAPVEPFLFVLVDVGVSLVLERRSRAATLTLALFGAYAAARRAVHLRDDCRAILQSDADHWSHVRRATAWLASHAEPGLVAAFDIGYLGHRTDWPIVDLVGLVTPSIARLPRGYSAKGGPALVDAVLARGPRYVILPSYAGGCSLRDLAGPGEWVTTQSLAKDGRFALRYRLLERRPFTEGAAWCIFEVR